MFRTAPSFKSQPAERAVAVKGGFIGVFLDAIEIRLSARDFFRRLILLVDNLTPENIVPPRPDNRPVGRECCLSL